MKSSVVMKSKDRILFGVTVRQSTNGSMLSLSDLQSAYNVARREFGWSEKDVSEFLRYKENQERIYYILEETQKVNGGIHGFTENLKTTPVKYLKSLGIWKTSRKEGTFVDPYVWVSIALWMNPKIYAKVVIWLTDQLIFSRIDAAIQYKPMTDAIKEYLEPKLDGSQQRFVYANEANMINEIIFKQKGKGLRQLASKEQLSNIAMLEKVNTNLIKKHWPINHRKKFLEELQS